MHMLLNDLLVAMVVVVMESNTYFQFSPPSVDTSIESFVEPDTGGADRHYIVGVSAQVFGFDDLKREIGVVKEVGVYSGLSVDIQ
jgi:hypothetical protein